MTKPLLIFFASGYGGLLRYWFTGLVQNWWGPTFPLGTLLVNLTGCLGIGFVATALSGSLLIRDEYRIAILVGIFGGYTTFSSFGREVFELIREDAWTRATIYVVLTNAIGLVAVWLGSAMATKLSIRGAP